MARSLLIGALFAAGFSAHVAGQTAKDLLQQVREDQRQSELESKEREKRFLAEQGNRKKLLESGRKEVAALEARAEALQKARVKNEAQLAKLRTLLDKRSGELKAMFGAVSLASGEVYAQARNSIVSAQLPARLEQLEAVATRQRQPDSETLELLWIRLLEEMTESGRVVEFEAPVVLPDGGADELDVVRIGSFGAVSDNDYLRYVPGTGAELGELQMLGAAPAGSLVDALREMLGQDVEKGVLIDPTRGELLAAQSEVPTLQERVAAGGVVGYVILALGAVGMVIALIRWLWLSVLGVLIKRQVKRLDAPKKGNPLGRVLLAYDEDKNLPPEALELKLDEAILREVPRLERGLTPVKLLAAVAPLLGLLGTVIGMIATFQSITQFGTSDPKLMAGGISQALMTTVLGLVVAIPLLFIHAFVASRSRRLVQLLDHQSAGLLAQRAEAAMAKRPGSTELDRSHNKPAETEDCADASSAKKADNDKPVEAAANPFSDDAL